MQVDRITAAELNPLIGSLFTDDTLANLSEEIGGLLTLMIGAGGNKTPTLYHQLMTIRAAIEFERENYHFTKQAHAEAA